MDPSSASWAFLDHPVPYAFAHRGGNQVAPENTVAAFQHAVDLGYRYLETDVHLTNDGVLVAFHDSGLERVAGLAGSVADHSWSELSTIDLGQATGIPTLDELLTTFPEHRFNIDPKADEAVAPLAEAIKSHRAIDRVCVGSFSDQRLADLRARLGRALCMSPGPRGLLALAAASRRPKPGRNLRFGAVQIPPTLGRLKLSAAQVERFQELGLQVHVWTINEESEMRRLLDLGVDALMTDHTQLLKDVLIDRGQWPQ